MTLFILLMVLFFALISLTPLLVESDPDAKHCVLRQD